MVVNKFSFWLWRKKKIEENPTKRRKKNHPPLSDCACLFVMSLLICFAFRCFCCKDIYIALSDIVTICHLVGMATTAYISSM